MISPWSFRRDGPDVPDHGAAIGFVFRAGQRKDVSHLVGRGLETEVPEAGGGLQ